MLFGTTSISARMIELFSQYDIAGVIKDEKTQGEFHGRNIVPLEEAVIQNTDIIVLTQQLLPTMDVFKRLKKFCICHNIVLLDIYGNELLKLIHLAERKKQQGFRLTEEDLILEINAHNVITWDIFDTLLIRRTLMPEDVFEIVGAKAAEQGICIPYFSKVRAQAQLDSGLYNPDIYEIYEAVGQISGISEDQSQKLAVLEIEVEKGLLIPRKKAVSLLQECKNRGKKVYLVSDMYLPGDVLEEILKENGITGYDGLYVSCDEKKLKNEGLFALVPGIAAENRKKILHIGDSLINDGICAGMLELDYCLLASPIELLRKTSWDMCVSMCESVNDRSILGLCAAELFSDPFALSQIEKKFAFSGMNQFGYVIVAPVVVSFLCWLIQMLEKDRKNREDRIDKILFAARDGFIIKELYDHIQMQNAQLPKSVYFYTSRKVAVMPDMANEAVINMLIDISRDLTPGEMLEHVFGVQKEDVLPWNDFDCEHIHSYVWKHKNKIFKKAEQARKHYFRYMGNVGLEIGKTYAFFDFVSSGTCQKSLMKYVPFDLKGYYFAWNSKEDKRQYQIQTYYNETDAFFMHHYKILELYMTSEEPSLTDFTSAGDVVFSKEMRSKEELSQIRGVHEAVLHFGRIFFHDMYVASERTSHLLAEMIYRNVASMDMPIKGLYDLEIVDDWKMKKIGIRETMRDE